MKPLGTLLVCFCSILLVSHVALSRPTNRVHELSEPETEADIVGDVDGLHPAPRKALQDTVWIADWTFDTGAPCDENGWEHVDNWIWFTGDIYWHIETGFATVRPDSVTPGISGNSYAVGYHDNACCADADGYDNDWYQGIRIPYTGAANISLDYIVDVERGFDFLQIETDSACSSYDRAALDPHPTVTAFDFRTIETRVDSVVTNYTYLDALSLSDYGAGTHCVYIIFWSDIGWSPCDGLQPTTVGEGIVIDNIVVNDAGGTRTEDFEDGTLDIGSALDMAEPKPFGTWARLFKHVTDNDICTENTTCSWLWSDDTTPTLFNDPGMAFGPGGYVVKNWLDEIIMSPWVSLASTPTANGTIFQMDRFGGNTFSRSRIVQNWSVRGRSVIQGSSCPTWWGHGGNWNSLGFFSWLVGLTWDMTPYFDPSVEDIQIRLRTSDWQWINNATPPVSFTPGPGPYNDRIRIGRRVLSGPVINEGIDSRSQAQSCFPTEIAGVTPAGDLNWRPSTDRFGTCAWSAGRDVSPDDDPNLILSDHIRVSVRAVRVGGDSITSVQWSGAIIDGPHAGKAPPPYSMDPNGFFTLDADSVRSSTGAIVANSYFVSLDDEYFRGGDQLVYFWSATDNGGGFISDPAGLSALPNTVEEAQEATQGLLQVRYLPTVDWDPAYLARIQVDPNGKLEPTAQELANSAQKNCILLYDMVSSRRLSGELNRSSFMYALDRLGYKGSYDVYSHQGFGNTNNQLGGRASVEQAQGYNLIIMDVGRTFLNLPDGSDLDTEKIDQAGWFSSWLAQASLSEAQFATLWISGENVLESKSGVPGSAATLLNTHMGVVLQSKDQGLNVNPDVVGVASFVFDKGLGSSPVDFAGDGYVLNGGCPAVRTYDGAATSTATAVVTHRYRSPTTNQFGDAAIVMNRNNAEAYNTIMQTHPFFDIRDAAGTPDNPAPELTLLSKVLAGVLPPSCLRSQQPTDAGTDRELDAPARTALHANVPNPFNPTTTIAFDLARESHVVLRIFDASGRLVRTLLNQPMEPKHHRIPWDGMDDGGRSVPSGIYFSHFEADGLTDSRKMVVLR